MRLIDADALLDKQESLYMKGNVLFHGVTACAIENAPTIDPETLPIVRELQEELEKAKKELEEGRSASNFGKCKDCEEFDGMNCCAWPCTTENDGCTRFVKKEASDDSNGGKGQWMNPGKK